jgi:hypothetical protein
MQINQFLFVDEIVQAGIPVRDNKRTETFASSHLSSPVDHGIETAAVSAACQYSDVPYARHVTMDFFTFLIAGCTIV